MGRKVEAYRGPGESRPDYCFMQDAVELPSADRVLFRPGADLRDLYRVVCFSRRRAARLDRYAALPGIGQDHELTLKYFEKMIAEAHRP